MKKYLIAIIVIVLIALLVALYSLDNAPLLTTSGLKPCQKIDQNPPELTSELAYCMGEFCRDANSKGDCEKIDVVNEKLVSGADGIPDCEWVSGRVGVDFNEFNCRPNK